MLVLMIMNIIIVSSLLLFNYLLFKQPSLLMMQLSILLCTTINYVVISSPHLINRLFVIMMLTLTAVYYIFKKQYNLAMPFPLPAVLVLLIPLLMTTSSQTTYVSTAYLSVSIFICGIIMLVLGIMDYKIEKNHFNVYSYIKHPVTIGLIVCYVPIVVMTMFMPYFYLYILWFALWLITLKLAENNNF